jgi:hypothetical protein
VPADARTGFESLLQDNDESALSAFEGIKKKIELDRLTAR